MNISFEEYRKRQVLLESCFDAITPDCSEELKENWLAVVFQETLPMSLETLREGTASAREKCDFHGQVLPLLFRLHNGN